MAGQVFYSGAFLQQCWSVHPLCLTVRRMTADKQIALACSSCRFAHYMAIGSVVHGVSAPEGPAVCVDAEEKPDPQASLASCIEAHPASLSLRDMDVFEDLAVIRCAACRRQYAVRVKAFETHQK